MGVRRPRIESGSGSGSGGGSSDLITYDGNGKYSDRFGETVTATNVKEALDQIFVFSSIDCDTNLTSGSSGLREKGDTLTSILLQTANVTGQNPTGTLTVLLFKRGSTTIETVNTPTASENYNETTAVTDTTTFTADLTDSEGRNDTNSITVEFVYPLLHIMGVAGLTPAQIYSGGTKIISKQENRTLNFVTVNQKPYYAIPQSEGTFSSILDKNGFETIGSWTRRDENITGLDGSAVPYYIYEFDNLTTTDMDYTFS